MIDKQNAIADNPESPDMAIADDAVPVCPHCFHPCDPLKNYCQNCGSNEAINPLTPYMPFVDIRFETGMYGKLWRKCWSPDVKKGSRLCHLSIFIFFMPYVFLAFIPNIIYEKFFKNKTPKKTITLVITQKLKTQGHIAQPMGRFVKGT